MKRRYFAATLTMGIPSTIPHFEQPLCIEDVYVFSVPSQRKQWLTEHEYPFGERVQISAKIAKKHEKHIEVEFRSAQRGGSVAWVWTYDNIPNHLMEMK